MKFAISSKIVRYFCHSIVALVCVLCLSLPHVHAEDGRSVALKSECLLCAGLPVPGSSEPSISIKPNYCSIEIAALGFRSVPSLVSLSPKRETLGRAPPHSVQA